MNLRDHYERVANTMLARFEETASSMHAGDIGANREGIVREFLRKHLPRQYGVTRGEMVTVGGEHSHSADIIIYDAISCPMLFHEETSVLPMEGVYGIIEVKSHLSKAEFTDAARKVERFKRLAPRDLTVIRTREYATVHRPSRPFGIVFGYSPADNSLDSLLKNWTELNADIHDVNFFTNFVCVLDAGLLLMEHVDLDAGEKRVLLETDRIVDLVLLVEKRSRTKEPGADNQLIRYIKHDVGPQSFGWFFVYLLITLNGMRLGVPDLGRYIDPDLPIQVVRES
jgi:hypothetical protein